MTLLLISTQGIAQHTGALKAHVFQSVQGLYTVAYEQAISERWSVDFSVHTGHYIDSRPTRPEHHEVTGTGAVTQLRYFPFNKKRDAPLGFFAYGALRYADIQERYRNSSTAYDQHVDGKLFNLGFGAGYKLAYRRVGVEAFIGWGLGEVRRDDPAYRSKIPAFFLVAMDEQAHFPQLELALCYMFSPFRRSED